MKINDLTIGIAGLGLMGAAIARALRDKCNVSKDRLLVCDKDSDTLKEAMNEGLTCGIFETSRAGEMLALCDIVFLCMNPSSIISFLDRWKDSFKKGCLITDIAGTKQSIAIAAQEFIEYRKNDNIDFIPGHPMAGAEKSGFKNSTLCNFNGKNYILTPLARNKTENLLLLKNIITTIGFSRVTQVTPKEHDQKIAFTSQLCHVIAASLINCENDLNITRFGGGSFEDLTRIAMLNAPMWTELFIQNSGALLDRINMFEKSLEELKILIKNQQADQLEEKLNLIKERRIAMSNFN